MLVLFETPAGYALFKMADEGQLKNVNDIWKNFETPEAANKILKLKAFSKFENTTDALSAATAIVEGKVSKNLKKFLQTEISEKDMKEKLAVSDSKLGNAIAKKLNIQVVSDEAVFELMRGIRTQYESLITGMKKEDMNAMVLGLSHSLSRYKLKFSPDKVDTMIIQAINLLDDLDKELNTYAMRVKEWYGWHFPEIAKIIVDNLAYAKTIKAMGFRTNAQNTDFSDILPEELEKEVKEAAEISMGTEISEEDIENIHLLCDQIISLTEYRTQLYDYLKNRMQAIAPNLTTLVGELVGARLIAHAGSLLNLAKHPASTVQILGAEKALFRALKTKHDTPKYGLIYHASYVGQAGPKLKGKMARTVASKAAISVRCDALGDKDTKEVGTELRNKIENRLRQLEGRSVHTVNAGAASGKAKQKKFNFVSSSSYNAAADSTIKPEEPSKKRKAEEEIDNEVKVKKEKKDKKEKKEKKDKKEKKEKKDKKEKKEKKDKKEKKEKKEKKRKEG
jgi:nucleolar protein 58